MRLLKFAPLLLLHLALSTMAHARSTPQRLWTLPEGAQFEALAERPGGRLGVYWQGDLSRPKYERFSIIKPNGKVLQTGAKPGQVYGGPVDAEDWNSRGQHAYLPAQNAYQSTYLRLKTNRGYRVLSFLPRFGDDTILQNLRFSPDGECLYVLGEKKLWIVGAQSARLLRVVKPRSGEGWSDENAALSPDCTRILAMRGKMTLYSTRTGKVLRRFGVTLKTLTGSCGSLSAEVFFSGDGSHAIAAMQDSSDYETWVYPAGGGKLSWHGRTPYDIQETARGHFFLETPYISNSMKMRSVLRRWRDGKVGWHLNVNWDETDFQRGLSGSGIIFSRDGHWIYFIRDRSVWRVAMPKLS